MIERRDFLKQSLAVTVGMMGSSAKAFASTNDFPTGLIYTSQNPGKWSENAKEHVPIVTLEGKKVVIHTPHQITSKHYIVRHTLVAENGKVLGERTFYPTELTATSTYELPAEPRSTLYATSFCNLHDFWVTEFKP